MFKLHPRSKLYACRENLPDVPAQIQYSLTGLLIAACWKADWLMKQTKS